MHYRPRDTVSVCGMNKIKDLRAIYSDNDNVSSTLLLLGTGAGLSHFLCITSALILSRTSVCILHNAAAATANQPGHKKDENFIENASTGGAAEIIIIKFQEAFFSGSIISFQEGLDFQLRQRAGKCVSENINTYPRLYAIGARRKNVFISLARSRSPDTIQNVIRSSSNMASSPFYTHQLLFLYYIMPHHAYLYVQKIFYICSAQGIPGADAAFSVTCFVCSCAE